MGNNPLPYDASVETAVNAFGALMNSGFIKIYTGSQPALNAAVSGTLLVSCAFGSTAFANATASAGIVMAAANAISTGVAVNSGTAGYFAFVKSDNSTVVGTGTCGVGSSFDMNMTSTTITFGGTVSIASCTLSMAET